MKTIIFVCTGNTCRSPMAEQILKAKLKEEGIQNVRVMSAGINVYPDSRIDEKAVNALKKFNIPVRRRKARQLTDKMIKNADYIITMTNHHKNMIKSDKVFTMDELVGSGDIIDPFMQPQEIYDKTAFALMLFINKLYFKILN